MNQSKKNFKFLPSFGRSNKPTEKFLEFTFFFPAFLADELGVTLGDFVFFLTAPFLDLGKFSSILSSSLSLSLLSSSTSEESLAFFAGCLTDRRLADFFWEINVLYYLT